MRDIRHPDEMTADQRLHELAAILAVGFLRLRQRSGNPKDSTIAKSPPNVGPQGLELSGPSRLTVTPR